MVRVSCVRILSALDSSMRYTGGLTAAAKPIHRQLPYFADNLPSDASWIRRLAVANKAIAVIQATHANSDAMLVATNDMISRARLPQDQAKKVNVRAIKATAAAIERSNQFQVPC